MISRRDVLAGAATIGAAAVLPALPSPAGTWLAELRPLYPLTDQMLAELKMRYWQWREHADDLAVFGTAAAIRHADGSLQHVPLDDLYGHWPYAGHERLSEQT